jgi:hypothetical protein
MSTIGELGSFLARETAAAAAKAPVGLPSPVAVTNGTPATSGRTS